MNGKSEHFLHYVIRDQIAKYYASGITPFRFKNGVNSAARASRARIAKNKSDDFERGYALTDQTQAYLKLGWVPQATLEGTSHGYWSVHFVWICPECQPVEPQREAA